MPFTTFEELASSERLDFLIIGGEMAGLAVAARSVYILSLKMMCAKSVWY